VARLFPRALDRRRAIMSRRRVGDAEMAKWFAFRPAAIPIHQTVEVGEAAPGVTVARPRRNDPLPAADYVA
jgi:hypothetical protein